MVGVGARTRSLLREGPLIVWSFIMLFIFAILGAVLALTALGMRFETATIAAIAAISNTGPAFGMVAEGARGFVGMTDAERGVLMALMVVGRVEMLALIALANPEAWRRARAGRERAGKTRARTARSDW